MTRALLSMRWVTLAVALSGVAALQAQIIAGDPSPAGAAHPINGAENADEPPYGGDSLVAYELQEGSSITFVRLTDDNGDAETITVALEGTFCRRPSDAGIIFGVSQFRARGVNINTPVAVRGDGWYRPLRCNSRPERMVLDVEIRGFPQPDDVPIRLDSGDVWWSQSRFPTIIIDLYQVVSQTNWYYTMHLVATPKRFIDFSTQDSFAAADPGGAERLISDGHLLRSYGRIVRTNNQLMRNFGIMPPTPDVGLDGVTLCPWVSANCCDIPEPDNACRVHLFSIEETVWSESLGTWLKHGDLLCECGWILRTNHDLIRNFGPAASTADVGLDAVDLHRNSEVWFSTEVGFWAIDEEGNRYWVRSDDLLSERGYVVRSIWDLLRRFDIAGPVPASPGLDAVVVRPNGEIYFSLETGLFTHGYGFLSPGDLLSDQGYVVARNYELIRPFYPTSTEDAGLDAVLLGPEVPCLTPSPLDDAAGE